MYIYLIRHGQTQGNKEKRYIGRTDDALTDESRSFLKKAHFPKVDRVYCSPLLRCRQTAELIYPEQAAIIVKDFRECDFGIFDNKNHAELNGNKDYQKWLAGEIAPPQGESNEAFQERCVKAFSQVVEQALQENLTAIALIVHGGTIMSIMQYYVKPQQDFYAWQVANGEGWQVEIEEELWHSEQCFTKIEKLEAIVQ